MKRKPRRDVIVRRFLAGESIHDLLVAYWRTTLRRPDIEDILRRELKRRRA